MKFLLYLVFCSIVIVSCTDKKPHNSSVLITPENQSDSLKHYAIILKSRVVNNKFYLVYSKYFTTTPKSDSSLQFQGLFINSYKFENLPANIGTMFAAKELKSDDKEIEISKVNDIDAESIVSFDELKQPISSDSSLYFYISLSRPSEIYDHFIIMKNKNQFTKLTDIEATDPIIKIQFVSDSLISFHYKYYTFDVHEDHDYALNLRTAKVIDLKKN